MGCSSSNNISVDISQDLNRIKSQKLLYNIRHEKLETVAQDILEDLLKKCEGSSTSINVMVTAIKNKKEGIEIFSSQDELRDSLKEIYMQQLLIDNDIVKEYDMYREVEQRFIANNLFMQNHNTKIELTRHIMQSMAINFPKTQKGAYLVIEPSELDDMTFVSALFANFKFNSTFQIEAMAIEVNNYTVTNPAICSGYADVIIANANLFTVVLNINSSISQQLLKNLDCIFTAIKTNDNVKLIIVRSETDGKCQLTPEIEKILSETVARSQILGLFLLKITMSENFMTLLAKSISESNSLRVLILESKFSNINKLDELVIQGIGRNRSLYAAFLAGFNIPNKKFDELSQVQGLNPNLKLFEYFSSLNY